MDIKKQISDFLDSKKSNAINFESEPFTLTRQNSDIFINGVLLEKADEKTKTELKRRIGSDSLDYTDPDGNDAIP